MKRALAKEKQEGEAERQEQAVVAALAGQGLVQILANVGHLVQVFRFHPIRFLQLMRVSSTVRKAFEQAQRDGNAPLMWYKFCLYAFPDYEVVLAAHNYPFLPATTGYEQQPDGVTVRPEWAMAEFDVPDDPLWTYMFGRPTRTHFVWTNSKMLQYDLTTADGWDVSFAAMQWRRHLDQSWYSESMRRRCVRDPVFAQTLSHCFRMFFPFALPPAEYCFVSQVALHQLAMELAHLLLNPVEADTERSHRMLRKWITGVKQRRTLHANDHTIEYTVRRLCYLDANEFVAWYTTAPQPQFASLLAPRTLQCNGAGPELMPNDNTGSGTALTVLKPDYDHTVYDLAELAATVLEISLAWKDLAEQAVKTDEKKALTQRVALFDALYGRVVLAALRYDQTGGVKPGDFNDPQPQYFNYVNGRRASPRQFTTQFAWRQQRDTDVELYGSHDPLQWDVMLVDLKRAEHDDAFLSQLSVDGRLALEVNRPGVQELYQPPGAWRPVLMQLLFVLVGSDTTSEKYLALSSSATATQCHQCGRASHEMIGQISAPFYAYCDRGCQEKKFYS